MQRHLSYANVVSTLCLFILLGGTSYAALQIPKNAVGNTQLKKNAVTSAKVKDRSLVAKDFKKGQLPTGARGIQGERGIQGIQGERGIQGIRGSVGPRGPSNGFHASAAIEVTLLDTMTEVNKIQLPAGNYVVIARVRGNNNDDTNEARVSCELVYKSLTVDESIMGLNDNTRFDDIQTMSLAGPVSIQNPTEVEVHCQRVNASDVDANASLVAVQTESVATTNTP